MGRNAHTWIMKAVPWVAVVVLGIFSIRQLADRSSPGEARAQPTPVVPAATGVPARVDPVVIQTGTGPGADLRLLRRAEELHGSLLALREERLALTARITALQQQLGEERTRGDHEASVRAALDAAANALRQRGTEKLDRLTQDLATAQTRITELQEENKKLEASRLDPDRPLRALVEALQAAKGKDWAQAATDLLDHEGGEGLLKTDAKLREGMCLMLASLDAGADRNDLAVRMLRANFAPVAKAVGPKVVLTPQVVSMLLHDEAADPREGIVSVVGTHGAGLDPELRDVIGVAVARILERPKSHGASIHATAARVLGLLRPSSMPLDALTSWLGTSDPGIRTAAAYALSRSREDLDRVSLRGACLALLRSNDDSERMAATMLGERIFDSFDFDPHAAPDARAKMLVALEAQAGS